MNLLDGVIRGAFGVNWGLPRVLEGIFGEVNLEGYRALWANQGLDHMGIN